MNIRRAFTTTLAVLLLYTANSTALAAQSQGTVLITGANRGIGLEMAKLYASRGDTVIACCRNPANADALSALAGAVEVVQTDVSDAASVRSLADTLKGRTIDLVINNAGVMYPEPAKQSVLDMDFDAWAGNFEVNAMGPVRILQALISNMQASDQAKLVTITSQMGALSLDMPFAYAYCTSKAALNKFMATSRRN